MSIVNPMSLEGKTVVVTGAGQGIGEAIAECCLALGANVVAIALSEKSAQAFAATHDAKRVLSLRGDVADPQLAPRVLEQALQRFGKVDGLVNNAGNTRAAPIEEMSLSDWQAVLDVHLNGSFFFLQAVGRHMLERAKAGDKAPGTIVNISSAGARRGTPTFLNYCAAKAGIFGMTMSAAREWGRFNIRVNSICYGVFETRLTEQVRSEENREGFLVQMALGRWGTLKEASEPVAFLLSDAASYITGQYLQVDGGYVIAL